MGQMVLQTCMGSLGALGFALIFNVRGKKLVWAPLGGALSWVIYLICTHCGLSVFLSLFISAALIAALCEVLARIIKAPVIMLLVPMLVPLIPGGDLYYTMYYLVRGFWQMFKDSLYLVITEFAALAVGIICVASITSLINNIAAQVAKKR